MKLRTGIFIVVLSVICAGLAPQAYAAKTANPWKAAEVKKASTESIESKFNLKAGAAQKVCLTCHSQFEDLLKKPSVHTPLKSPGCIACHSPHASNFPKQLSAEVSTICLTCHAGIMTKGARSTHKVALEGKCVQCHDPHASDNKNNLRKAGNDLCFDCHKDKGEEIKKLKFKHSPVEKGCINCHNPHSAPKASALLKSEVPELCKECHDTKKPLFVKQHMSYPVENTRCTLCHSVHGSNRSGLIYDTAHKPFASKSCNLCHEGPTAPNPLALKKTGFELCRGCHNNSVNEMLSKNRLHWPVLGKDACLNCHNPHASPQAGLLRKAPIQLCGGCHADTIRRQELSVTKHKPIKDGQCMSCHVPHASDNTALFIQSSMLDLCGTCHDYMKHSTHPVGEKVIDKRNKNLTVQCLSCHRSHGTEFKKMLPFETVAELCTQCHTEYKR
jgi:DmsE family decaheme c-type cytochrome